MKHPVAPSESSPSVASGTHDAVLPSSRLGRATLRALVVEDEWPARNYLVELLECSGLAEVVGAVATAAEARQAIRCRGEAMTGIDVAFIDVDLGGLSPSENGLRLVHALADDSAGPMFVLATAHNQHAVEAFDLGVVDYLVKPYGEERVSQCLGRLLERRSAASRAPLDLPRRVVARRRRSLVFLELQEIWAFEASDRLSFVHSLHGTFDLDLSLAAVESSFGRTFVRTHRNWLVNASHIKEFGRHCTGAQIFVGTGVAEGGQGIHIPVARERAADLCEMLFSNATGLRRC
jgi:DNA-binding LytR/AlgR family response regulator